MTAPTTKSSKKNYITKETFWIALIVQTMITVMLFMTLGAFVLINRTELTVLDGKVEVATSKYVSILNEFLDRMKLFSQDLKNLAGNNSKEKGLGKK